MSEDIPSLSSGGGDLKEATALVQAAEVASQPKKWLMFRTSPDYQEAAELYNRAAIIFKGVREWRDAGDAYRKAAEMEAQAGEPDEGARKLLNAASCYKKCDVPLAIETIERALEVLLRGGRFHLVAAQEKEIAELYETQLDDSTQAIRYYERAAERYAGEDSQSISQTCRLKAASLAALTGDVVKAARVYEDISGASVSDPIRQYTVKDHLFRAGLCRLADEDRVAARRAIEGYPAIDISFGSGKESTLLITLLDALEAEDLEAFTTAVTTFDRTNPLDDWKTKMLLRIKRSINEAPGLT